MLNNLIKEKKVFTNFRAAGKVMEQDTNAPGPQIYLFMYFKLEETTRWAAVFHPSLTNREKMPEMLKAECTLYEIHCEQ